MGRETQEVVVRTATTSSDSLACTALDRTRSAASALPLAMDREPWKKENCSQPVGQELLSATLARRPRTTESSP
jgi:hypothetical protein